MKMKKLVNRMEWIRDPGKRGDALVLAAGLFFYLLCMLLPLVGPAGARVDHALQNRLAFLLVLGLMLALSIAALLTQRAACRLDPARKPPRAAWVLTGIGFVLLIAQVSGLLSV
jgi:uncharacterized membrane protein YidH (DUF202 family)